MSQIVFSEIKDSLRDPYLTDHRPWLVSAAAKILPEPVDELEV
jgi:hypothetical protein